MASESTSSMSRVGDCRRCDGKPRTRSLSRIQSNQGH